MPRPRLPKPVFGNLEITNNLKLIAGDLGLELLVLKPKALRFRLVLVVTRGDPVLS